MTAALNVATPDTGGWLYSLIVAYGPTAMSWALAALGAVGSWVLARIGAQRARRAVFEELGAHARDIVQEVWQTYVEEIKLGTADGNLTASEKAHARALAIAKLKDRLSLKALVALGGGWIARLFTGSSWAAKVESIVGGAVETAVAESKRDARVAVINTAAIVPKVAVLPASLTPSPPSTAVEVQGGPPVSPR